MKISVVIINFFSSSLIKRLILEICNHSTIAKIILVDNSNSSIEFERLNKILQICKKVTVIRSHKNLGFAKACNVALKKVETDFFMLLNPDTYIDEKSLNILIKKIINNKTVGAVSPISFWDRDYEFYLPPLILPSPMWDIANSAAFRFYFIRYLLNIYIYRKTIKSLNRSIKTSMLSGGHILIKKKVLNDIKYLFDENFFMYYEDSDLSIRLRKAGYKLILEKDAKVVHFWHDSIGKIELQKESKEYYFKKHFKFLKFWKYIQKFIEKFPLKEPKKYIDLGELQSLNSINDIIKNSNAEIVELGFHYTFIPAIVYFVNKKKISFNKIEHYLKNGEYWLKLDRNTIYKFNYKKTDN